jgi:hypothetical protein
LLPLLLLLLLLRRGCRSGRGLHRPPLGSRLLLLLLLLLVRSGSQTGVQQLAGGRQAGARGPHVHRHGLRLRCFRSRGCRSAAAANGDGRAGGLGLAAAGLRRGCRRDVFHVAQLLALQLLEESVQVGVHLQAVQVEQLRAAAHRAVKRGALLRRIFISRIQSRLLPLLHGQRWLLLLLLHGLPVLLLLLLCC